MSSQGVTLTAQSPTWRVQLFLVVVGGLACWLAFKSYTGIQLEDALITFRYAENLASGRGFAYNPGENVLGTTTPLLTLILGAAGRVFGVAAIPTAAAIGMTAASVGTAVIIAMLIVRAGKHQLSALLGAAVFCVHPTTFWMTTGGMETPLVLLLMTSSLYAASLARWNLTACLLALLVLTRIDGMIWAGLIGALALTRERGRRLISPALVWISIVGIWLIFATLYFGSPVPQSLVAKRAIGQAAAPLRVYVNWALDALGFTGRASGIWLVCIAVESTAILASGAKSILILFVLYPPVLCATYWLGAAPLDFPWYSVPITLCGLILGVCGATRSIQAWCATDRQRRARLSVTVGAGLIVTLLAEDLLSHAYRQFMIHRRVQANEDGLRRAVGEWLARATPREATVAMEAIGYTGTYSNRRVIDLAGLISPEVVALYKSASSHAVAFERVLLSLRPDYLVLRSFEVDINQHYHGGDLFETEEQRRTFNRLYEEAARFSAPYPEVWGRVAYLTVYRRRAGS